MKNISVLIYSFCNFGHKFGINFDFAGFYANQKYLSCDLYHFMTVSMEMVHVAKS